MSQAPESAGSGVPSVAFERAQLQTLLDLISDGIWDWNANTGYVYRNPGWYQMLGYASHSLDNSVFTWESVIHPDDYPRVMEHFEAYITQRAEQYRVQYRCKCQDGSYLWIEDSGHVIARNPDGSVARMLGAHRNIDASKRLLQQLEQQNHSLEALVAERTRELSWVNQQLQRQLDENRDLAERDALIVMDLDDFKPINDRYGHARGDRALVDLVERIRSCLHEPQLLARWGGDEFAVVLAGASLDDARRLAMTIRQVLEQAPPIGECQLTMSYGVVQRLDGEDQAQLMARADSALYRAKTTGKDRVSE
jgi:diguanylate cyclase (GGDEF)-like protein/PAS domain S-box-containing protein